MARRFAAERYTNCAECEDLIEPGDDAGYTDEVKGAVCRECFDYFEEVDFWATFQALREGYQ